MPVKTFGCALECMEATTVTIELNLGKGHQRIISGLPDDSVKESLARIEAALISSGYRMPDSKLVYNLYPASLKKTGTSLDLPMAIALLVASGQISSRNALAEDFMICGELSLSGSVQSIRGALNISLKAWKEKFKGVLVPMANVQEAAVVSKIPVYGVQTLKETVQFLNGQLIIEPYIVNTRALFYNTQYDFDIDFRDVRGQAHARRALEIAAAGSHNALLIGPPGSGKSMLSSRMPTILPPLTLAEALDVTRIYSVCDNVGKSKNGLISRRPFIAPHHTSSNVALVGGGSYPMPGQISQAHNGVLFLDELPEFSRAALESLRQPLESGEVKIARALKTMIFPASFMLIASMNPCQCGYLNHPQRNCSCSPKAIQKYLGKISGPLMDRIDLHIEVFPVSAGEMTTEDIPENSETIRSRVQLARNIQTNRFEGIEKVNNNAQMTSSLIKKHCRLEKEANELLISALQNLKLSGRAYDRILKVSRTIADLDEAGSETIRFPHVSEAIGYRSLDKETWIIAAYQKPKKTSTKKASFKIA
jgi:magnesium chelatase family protein